MRFAVYLPFLASLLIGLAGPVVARRAAPAAGAVGLATAALVSAIGCVWAAVLLVVTILDDILPFRAVDAPVPDPVAVAAGTGLLVAAVCCTVHAHRRGRLHRGIIAAVGIAAVGRDGLLVLPDPWPDAFALPAPWRPWRRRRSTARIVITDGMLAALSPLQQRVLIAHEQAHLAGRHHYIRAAAEYAAVINPALRGARRSVAFLCERAADEAAYTAIGDRRAVMEAIGAAALASSGPVAATGRHALTFHSLGVVDRVTALGRPPRGGTVAVLITAVTAGVLIVLADAHATADLAQLVARLTGG